MKTFWQNDKTDIYIKLYDDMAAGLKTGEELDFIKKHFTKKQQIIEFGCGTGRTLIPLLKAGYRISGLDFSKGMLGLLQKKLKANKLKTPVFNKNLVNFSLAKKYDGGILSQRTLNFITTPEEQRHAVQNIAGSLKKGAPLIISLMPARPRVFAKKRTKFTRTYKFKNSATGNMVEFWEKWLPDQVAQTLDYTEKFIEKKRSETTRAKMRLVFKAEMEYLLELCGFKVLDIFGNWKGAKYDTKATDFIVVAKKK
jgi:SAM-dependent methyltransferase